MPYPNEVTADLLEINGNSCGVITGTLEFVDDADPPEYIRTAGNYPYARLWRIDLGNGSYTWQLKILYRAGGPCIGMHNFRLSTAADDPVGNYCKYAGAQIDCTAGKALVVSND